MPLAQLTVMVAALLGWPDGITIQSSRSSNSTSAFQRTTAAIDRPSERTLETLKRYDLKREYEHDAKWNKDSNGGLLRLENVTRMEANAELVYAMAELSWLEGKRFDRRRKEQALDRYLDAAAYAHDYLLDPNPEIAAGRGASDPRFRLACDIYSACVERVIRAAQTRGEIQLQNGEAIPFKIHGPEQVLRIVLNGSPWTSSDLDKILVASDFEVIGLHSRTFNQFGMGVPLIGIREGSVAKVDGNGKPIAKPREETFYPPEMAFPLTAMLTLKSRLRADDAKTKDDTRVCTLELIDPVQHQSIGQGSQTVIPLETDLTTPMAYEWARTDLDRYRWSGLLRPEQALERANLLMIRPYERGKIPVVMVHGLISSPLAWIPMLNELLRDPVIQQKYQFMLFMYPTGVPIPIAASVLRDSLTQAKQIYDPSGEDPAFDKMVLLGHSMGGLLSRTMAVSSGDSLWKLYSDRSFNYLIGPRDVLDELRKYLIFEPLPFVKQVVFMGTPHRGSELSRGVVGRIGNNLISDSDHIHNLLTRLVKDNSDAFDGRRFKRFPTSIEALDPTSPILGALLSMQPPSGSDVHFHSIIGSLRPTGVDTSTDGVVPYRSAHIEGVASEKVVRSDHGVQRAPEAILEVRRILREHLGVASPPAGLAPSDRVSAEPAATAKIGNSVLQR